MVCGGYVLGVCVFGVAVLWLIIVCACVVLFFLRHCKICARWAQPLADHPPLKK